MNPVNQERLPIWIADYVLMSYGTSAIMAVPAHDERDWAFARQYQLPIREVIAGGMCGSGLHRHEPWDGCKFSGRRWGFSISRLTV